MNSLYADLNLESLNSIGIKAKTSKEAIRILDKGLPVSSWEKLVSSLGVNEQAVAYAVQITLTTLSRRKKEGFFSNTESERIFRLVRLVSKARQVFSNPEALGEWFNEPNHGLGDSTPLDFARTPIGATEVERVLERILDGGPA
jgi:putative toxin-antitoxin system antitoxin component (TIGR02293 family)